LVDGDFNVEVHSTTSEITVRLFGDLDAFTAHVITEQLPALIIRGDDHTLVFDFAHLRFIDASGLGILVAANTSLALDGRRLEIRNPSDFVMKLFRITGLDRILRLPEI
jgi:anti-anti-sigma factor